MSPEGTEAVSAPPAKPVQRFLTDGSIRGSPVRNSAGEDFGNIHELLVDIYEARIIAVVLSVGGYLGHSLGGKNYAIPWPAFSKRSAEDVWVLDISREKLEKAPPFDMSWAGDVNQDYINMIYSYFGYEPYWGEGRRPG